MARPSVAGASHLCADAHSYLQDDAGNLDFFGSSESDSPDAELWRQVIVRAALDLGVALPGAGKRNKGTGKVGTVEWRERLAWRREAVSWFTSEDERKDFELVCDLANVDSAVVRTMAYRVIQERQAQHDEEDSIFESLFGSQKSAEYQAIAAE